MAPLKQRDKLLLLLFKYFAFRIELKQKPAKTNEQIFNNKMLYHQNLPIVLNTRSGNNNVWNYIKCPKNKRSYYVQ